MKVRNGFVSNSSSSSFLIYGVTVEGGVPIEDLTEEALNVLNTFDGVDIEELRERGGVGNNNDEIECICSTMQTDLIYGIDLDEEGGMIAFKDLAEYVVNLYVQHGNYYHLGYYCHACGLEWWTGDGSWVGKSWSKKEDNQTDEQFKESIIEQLKKLIKPECGLWKNLKSYEVSYDLKNEGAFNAS